MNPVVPTGFYGTSLALEAGDLVFDGTDLALVSGRDNFAQALGVIVGTPFGSDPVNVGYGLDVAAIFTVAGTVRSVKDVIRLNLVKSLSLDDRVREITEIVFDDEPDFATLAPEFPTGQARLTRSWHAVAVFTTVAGDPQTVLVSGPAG